VHVSANGLGRLVAVHLRHLMASLAQMERELIIERTRAGLEAARRQGRVGGLGTFLTSSVVIVSPVSGHRLRAHKNVPAVQPYNHLNVPIRASAGSGLRNSAWRRSKAYSCWKVVAGVPDYPSEQPA
jgi:Resolvase, N terminal domain